MLDGDLLEAIYAVDRDESTWLDGIMERIEPFLPGSAWVAHTYDASDPEVFRVSPLRTRGAPPEAHAFHQIGISHMSRGNIEQTYLRHRCAYGSVVTPPQVFTHFQRTFEPFGILDNLGINGLNLDGTGVLVCALTPTRGQIAPDQQDTYERIARHFAAAGRLRRKLAAENARPVDAAEVLLDASGAVHHTQGRGKSPSVRARLRELVTELERARGGSRSGGRILKVWSALFEARWSLIDHFDRDGRRFIIAAENQPRTTTGTLTRRETQVMAYAARGFTAKEIGYELGISPTTVRVLLARARKKRPPPLTG